MSSEAAFTRVIRGGLRLREVDAMLVVRWPGQEAGGRRQRLCEHGTISNQLDCINRVHTIVAPEPRHMIHD